MFQCFIIFPNDVVPFSIASMAFSKATLVHLPLVLTGLHLLTFFFVGFDLGGGTLSLSYVGLSFVG
jgi:hypothetical protein